MYPIYRQCLKHAAVRQHNQPMIDLESPPAGTDVELWHHTTTGPVVVWAGRCSRTLFLPINGKPRVNVAVYRNVQDMLQDGWSPFPAE